MGLAGLRNYQIVNLMEREVVLRSPFGTATLPAAEQKLQADRGITRDARAVTVAGIRDFPCVSRNAPYFLPPPQPGVLYFTTVEEARWSWTHGRRDVVCAGSMGVRSLERLEVLALGVCPGGVD